LNPSFIKKARHQRGNSDGIYNIASRLFINHTRGSSGSNNGLSGNNFANKTFEENATINSNVGAQ
jgi:hypothetical protein